MTTPRAKGRIRCAAALLLFLWRPAPSRGAEADVRKIVGTWRGTSTCVDLKAAPACKDEVAIYEIGAAPGASDRVVVKGYKVVGGERQYMGDLEYTLGRDGVWTSDFESPNVRSHWTLTVDGSKMTGTATLVPSNALIRRMELERKK
ncbi:MAG TPA: hypothetical protein VH854_00765 [Thermoanaerobaculia bacterium]|nr:hypothetical protein [Thermoanaerobaculia bacterium]